MPIRLLVDDEGDYEEYHLPPEKRLAGDPKQQVWLQYTDASGRYFAGTWASEAGKWKIAYTEEEYCEIVAGESVITEDAGAATTVRAGDRFVIPRGFAGTWEVVVPTRKVFVIFEPGK